MTRALAWIRKSKGSDDDIGLEIQRDDVAAAATEIADDIDTLDLGIQSGFSTITRDADASTQWLDQNSDVEAAVERIKAGEYDFLVAFDDRRVARDDYLSVIKHATVQGDCEFVYVSNDVETGEFAYDIQRRVERKTKEEEIKKSKRAIRERIKKGYYQGNVPFGLSWGPENRWLVKDDQEWEQVLEALEAREEGASLRDAADAAGITHTTVSRIEDRGIEYYEELLAEYGREERLSSP